MKSTGIILILLCSCTPTKPLQVNLNGSKSYDPDGYITKWEWRQVNTVNNVNIGNPNLVISPITITQKGVYKFELTVTDNDGAIGKDTCIVNNN